MNLIQPAGWMQQVRLEADASPISLSAGKQASRTHEHFNPGKGDGGGRGRACRTENDAPFACPPVLHRMVDDECAPGEDT